MQPAFATPGTKGDVDAGCPEHHFGYGFLSYLDSLAARADQLADQSDGFFTVAMRHKTKVADFDEPVGQHVKQKTADELDGSKCHVLDFILIGPVTIGEGHTIIFKRYDPVVGYGHPMGVAAKIVYDLLRAGKWPFGIDDPIFSL